MESELRHIDRWEWWLWFSVLGVTARAGRFRLLASFHSLFLHNEHFFEIRSDQARWGILSLLLLFNVWLVYRQRVFRRLRRRLTELREDAPSSMEVNDPSQMDPVTGFYTRASVEQSLGREVARAKRHNQPLSLVALHLDDFADLNKRCGRDAAELVLKAFANRLRKASRGCDFCVRLGDDEFLVILPECSLGDAKLISDRLGTLEMKCAGEDVTVVWSVGWIDYKRGEVPADLFKRAKDVLQLYKAASKDSSAPTLVIR